MKQPILSMDQLEKIHTEEKDATVVLVGGCFDLLHYGHVTFLKNAKKLGTVLVVALESDEFIRKRKKRQPVHSQKQRAEILSTLEMVDYIVLLPFLDKDSQYLELVKKIKPQIIAVTDEDPYLEVKRQHANRVGAKLKIAAPLLQHFSTSNLLPNANLSSD